MLCVSFPLAEMHERSDLQRRYLSASMLNPEQDERSLISEAPTSALPFCRPRSRLAGAAAATARTAGLLCIEGTQTAQHRHSCDVTVTISALVPGQYICGVDRLHLEQHISVALEAA